MKIMFCFKLIVAILLFAFTSVRLAAQPIYSSTLTGPNLYNIVGGAFIPTGNVVTVAPGALAQFNFGLSWSFTQPVIH